MGKRRRPAGADAAAELDFEGTQQILTANPRGRHRLARQLRRRRCLVSDAGQRAASSAKGCFKSIIAYSQTRKKSSVAIGSSPQPPRKFHPLA
jgi:hypothetical protein